MSSENNISNKPTYDRGMVNLAMWAIPIITWISLYFIFSHTTPMVSIATIKNPTQIASIERYLLEHNIEHQIINNSTIQVSQNQEERIAYQLIHQGLLTPKMGMEKRFPSHGD